MRIDGTGRWLARSAVVATLRGNGWIPAGDYRYIPTRSSAFATWPGPATRIGALPLPYRDDVTRIIAGMYGGRRLATPTGEDTRPTADRVREAMFSGLEATHVLYGRRFLDLYAGSGAVGLEAASRGAEHVLLVESDPRAIRVVRDNISALDAGDVVSLATHRVASVLAAGPSAITFRDGAPTGGPGASASNRAPTGGPGASASNRAPTGDPGASASNGFDIVFADPPYAASEVEITAMLAALADHGWLNARALVILERSKRSSAPIWVPSLTAERSRRYGETMLWYGRRS